MEETAGALMLLLLSLGLVRLATGEAGCEGGSRAAVISTAGGGVVSLVMI